jgi:Cysteine-rich secretory protein family
MTRIRWACALLAVGLVLADWAGRVQAAPPYRGCYVGCPLGSRCVCRARGSCDCTGFDQAAGPLGHCGHCRRCTETDVTFSSARPSSAATPVADDSPAGFVAGLNRYRAGLRLSPLAWDGDLARFAALNTSNVFDPVHHGHSPRSRAPGASQCQASTASYTEALRQWIASPDHQALLRSARGTVGIARCPSGMTVNMR